jgi:hypothetical protein
VVTHRAREKFTTPGEESGRRRKAIGKERNPSYKKKGKILHGNPRALNSGKKALNDDANISND